MARLIGNVDATGSLSTSVSTPATNASAVSLYLPFDTNVNDTSGNAHTVTANGNAAVSAGQSQFGGKSLALDGNGDSLSLSHTSTLQMAGSDFTIEAWVYISAHKNFNYIFSYSYPLQLLVDTNGNLELYVNDTDNSTSYLSVISSVTLSTATWHFIVVTRNGSSLNLFVDGSAAGSTSISVNLATPAAFTPRIGDWGDGGYSFNGYIDDFRVTKGIALYTRNFVPPSQAVGPSLSGTNETNSTTGFTSLYLPFDSSINDASAHAHGVTASGNASISSSQARFGSYSLALDGTGDYLTISDDASLEFGSGDLTIEAFFYENDNTGHMILQKRAANGGWSTGTWLLAVNAAVESDADDAGKIQFWAWDYNSTANLLQFDNGSALSPGFHHLCVTRSSDVWRLFLDGTQVDTDTWSGAIGNATHPVTIGRDTYAGRDRYYANCFIDDLRILKGFAKYTASFTPPTSAVTATVSQTRNDLAVLYMPFDDLQDKARNHPVTANGNAAVSATQAKFGVKSLALDGSGDYLTVASGTDFQNFNSLPFTIEGFFYCTNDTSNQHNVIMSTGTGSNSWNITVTPYQKRFQLYSGGTAYTTNNTGWTVNTWHHFAVCFDGSTLRQFIDGAQIRSDSYSNLTTTFSNIDIGRLGGSDSLYFNGYLDDITIIKGFAKYTAAFTPPTAASGGEVIDTITDTRTFSSVWSLNSPEVTEAFKAGTWPGQAVDTQYTKLYMSFDTNVQDESPSTRTVTASGNAAVSNTQAKFGSSLYLDGSGDYLTVPHASDLNLYGSDFTIEAWVYNTSFPSGSGAVISKWTGSSKEFVVFTIASGLYFYWSHNGSTNNLIQSTDGFSLNTWHHIAITSSSNVGRLFVDGQLQSATANFSSTPIYQSTTPVLIGARDGGGVSNFAGYIDDLMVLKGHARYTASFTPPTAASGGGI